MNVVIEASISACICVSICVCGGGMVHSERIHTKMSE